MATRAPEAPLHVDQQSADGTTDQDPGYSRAFKARAAASGFGRAVKESYIGTAYGLAEKVYGKGESRLRRVGGAAVLLAATTPAVWGLARGVNMLEHMGADALTMGHQPMTGQSTQIELGAHNTQLVDASEPTSTPVKNTEVKSGEGLWDLLDRDLGKGKQNAEIKELIWGDSKEAKQFRAALYEHDDAVRVRDGDGGWVPSMIGGDTHGERQLSSEAFAKLQAFDTQWDTDHPPKSPGVDPAHTLEGGRTIHLGEGGKTLDITLPKGYEHELTQTKNGFELKINPDGKAQSFTIEIPEKYVDKHGALTAEGRTYLESQMKTHHLTVDLAAVEAKPNAEAKPGDDKLQGKEIVWHNGENEKTLAIHNNGLITVDLDPKGAQKSGGFPQWKEPFFMAVTDKHNNVYMIPIENSNHHGKVMIDPDSSLGKVLQNGTFRTAVVGQMDGHGKFHGMPAVTGTGRADFSEFGSDPATLTGTHTEVKVTEQQAEPPRRPELNGGNSPSPTDSPSPTNSASPSSSPSPTETHSVAHNEKEGDGNGDVILGSIVAGVVVAGGAAGLLNRRRLEKGPRSDWRLEGPQRQEIEDSIFSEQIEEWMLANRDSLNAIVNDPTLPPEARALAVRSHMRGAESQVRKAVKDRTKFLPRRERAAAAQSVVYRFNRERVSAPLNDYFQTELDGSFRLDDGHLVPIDDRHAEAYVQQIVDYFDGIARRRSTP